MNIFNGHGFRIYVERSQELSERDNSVICSLFDCNLLKKRREGGDLSQNNLLKTGGDLSKNNIIEVGPIISMETPWGSNAKSILKKCGINVSRIEKTKLFSEGDAVEIDKMVEIIYDKPLETFKAKISEPFDNSIYEEIVNLSEANDKYQLGFDEQDLKFYEDYFKSYNHKPNLIELMDMSQSNSEHSRHWFFKGKMLNGPNDNSKKSLFKKIKSTLTKLEDNGNKRSTVAFSDNSSAIKGFEVKTIIPNPMKCQNELGGVTGGGHFGHFTETTDSYDIAFTAETHNFPTGIAPFQGATTGTGGRIRDGQSIGKGGLIVAGTSGYCVGEITKEKSEFHEKNLFTLLKASDGASDYGNKFGEPLVLGFCRTFGKTFSRTTSTDKSTTEERIEWVKPIMFSGGIGQMLSTHKDKEPADVGMVVAKIGGPAYRIGVGGGAASSRDQDTKNEISDLNAVQRGDAEMENKLNRIVRACIEMGEDNPILSIHDQGAGGTGNVTKEIVYNPNPGRNGVNVGAEIYLSNVVVGDETMSDLELWISEYQEQDTILIDKSKISLLSNMCIRENVPFAVIGEIVEDPTKSVRVYTHTLDKDCPAYSSNEKCVINLPLEGILGNDIPQKEYDIDCDGTFLVSSTNTQNEEKSVYETALSVLSSPSVGSKRFLTVKVDRSVTGLVAQQQCVGPFHTPLSDYAVIAQSHFGVTGSATAIGERPLNGIYDPKALASMALTEMLSGLMFAKITSINDIRISGNWMWPLNAPNEKAALVEACDELTRLCGEMGVALDGGKDSLSMVYKDNLSGESIKCPRQLVLSGYAPMEDVHDKVTPEFKFHDSAIMFIDLANGSQRMGCSSYEHSLGKGFATSTPDLTIDPKAIAEIFEAFQTCWFVNNSSHYFRGIDPSKKGGKEDMGWCLNNSFNKETSKPFIFAGHDRSDGGLFTTISEMAIAGNVGVKVFNPYFDGFDQDNFKEMSPDKKTHEWNRYWLNEEAGFVVEIHNEHIKKLANIFRPIEEKYNIQILHYIGKTTEPFVCAFDDQEFTISDLRMAWESNSLNLEAMQCNSECVEQERKMYENIDNNTRVSDYVNPYLPINEVERNQSLTQSTDRLVTREYKVAIIREEGSNGDREMSSAFYMAGFEVYDICMNDFINNSELTLEDFRGVAFVGGFSYSDVGGAAKGWYQVIKSHPRIQKVFDDFYNRKDTFSLGICNGCQLMTLLGWVKDCKIVDNKSGRFESRFSSVRINPSNSILLKDMDYSELGVWVAHGEGQFVFEDAEPNKERFLFEIDSKVKPSIQYIDFEGQTTDEYPHNPNGSEYAAAAVCSENGRHLAMMPHPERCFLKWQWPRHYNFSVNDNEEYSYDDSYDSRDEKNNAEQNYNDERVDNLNTKYRKFSPWFGLFTNAYKFCEDTF
jgi:phosphoribosylformylglycinamidine synthase